MDTNLVQQVTIVGGGTAGWLTAAILNAKLNPPRAPRRVEIVLIESPTIPTVGVGEGTLPAMGQVLRDIGVDEREFMKACNASFKYGVRFEGWNRDEQGRECSFMHPFASPGILDDVGAINYFLAFGPQPGRARRDVADSLCLGPEFIALHRAPRPFGAAQYGHIDGARYSYHFDAGKLAVFMRDFAVKRGVIHLLDDVDDATLDENGHIKELRLRRTGVRPVELVVDCTGFQGLLLGKVLNEPFVPYANHLLCDRAIPIQIPHAEGAPLKTCTTATAMSAGWIWKVPLYSRIGTGYVFSSQFR